jgi:hypothetical protein
MSSERTPAAPVSVDPVAWEAGRSVAALFDVLDRLDTGSVARRPAGRRPAAYRPAGARGSGVRTVPLRSVQPAPSARPVARALPVPGPVSVPAAGRLVELVRRAALWGAGPRGEHLAWRPAAPRTSGPAPVPAPVRPARLRGLVRRTALWGAGPNGEHLAWGGPVRPVEKAAADRPVVLRELPSTPTVPAMPRRPVPIQHPPLQHPTTQPAATSPAAVLPPHGPASTGPRWMPPVPRGAVAVPGVRPGGRPERSRATGWPPQVPASGVATGLVRARGDPLPGPARGSPAPARRSRSPGSLGSSFP